MASYITGIGNAMNQGLRSGLALSNDFANYQNQNLVDQYKYPAYMAEANSARTGAELNTLNNINAQARVAALMQEPSRLADPEQEQVQYGQGQPQPQVQQSYAANGVNPVATSFPNLFGQSLQQNGDMDQAMQQALKASYPSYMNF